MGIVLERSPTPYTLKGVPRTDRWSARVTLVRPSSLHREKPETRVYLHNVHETPPTHPPLRHGRSINKFEPLVSVYY